MKDGKKKIYDYEDSTYLQYLCYKTECDSSGNVYYYLGNNKYDCASKKTRKFKF